MTDIAMALILGALGIAAFSIAVIRANAPSTALQKSRDLHTAR